MTASAATPSHSRGEERNVYLAGDHLLELSGMDSVDLKIACYLNGMEVDVEECFHDVCTQDKHAGFVADKGRLFCR
jgi:hypothetical protein